MPDLHAVGFPIVEIDADGALTVGKADGTGGVVDGRTVKEQLLYEMHDPAAYLTPDVVADISEAEVEQVGPDRVAVRGVRGRPRTETLKVIAFFAGGWLGEGEISYAGPNAEARARLAADVIRRRMGEGLEIRYDLIGVLSVFGDDDGRALGRVAPGDARDVRLRVAASHPDRARVEALLREVTALYTCGPAGGGGVRTAITPAAELRLVPRPPRPGAGLVRLRGGVMASDLTRVPLHRLAHGRAGDKGDTANISVIAYRPEVFPLLVEQVTEARVADLFRDRSPSAVRRYVLPRMHAMNFVLEGVLDGGVNEALGLDTHGKTLAFLLLGLEVEVPAELARPQ